MAARFHSLGIQSCDLTKPNYSPEELSLMSTMEQLIVANQIRNQQMLQTLGLNAITPKQQNTKDKKYRKKTNEDANWTPDMAAEEDSDNVDTHVRKKYCATGRKSNKPFAHAIEPDPSANNTTISQRTLSLPTVASTPFTKSAKRRNRKKATQTASLASETDKPASPSNTDSNSNGQQNHPSQKNTFGSSTGKTPETTTGPAPGVQPFTGFTDEQIEAARQRCIEAQNRKEAIIRLMRTKLLNKDDLTIIEPVDREVLQEVLKRRKQDTTEQPKAEQRNKFEGRFPRRNVTRKNCQDSSEDDDILDEDTTYTFHCDKCKNDYECCHISPTHQNASGNLDKEELDSRPQGYHAIKSLPECMLVKESPIPGAGRGVFTGQFTTLRKDTIYGPYEGVRVYNESEAHQSGYCWQIHSKRKISHWIDARQVRRSNWLRYINCAATMDQQNVCAYQVGQNIYYRTVVNIGPDKELLVWYGDDYAKELGLHSMAFMASINSSTSNDVDRVCWDCQLEFRCRQLFNHHKFTAHNSVNSNIIAFVGATRFVTNTAATRQVRGSVAKSGLVVHKPRVAGSACSAISGVAVSPYSTASDAKNSDYKQHESYVATNDGFGAPSARLTCPVVNKCQVTAASGGACMSLSGVQSSVDVSRAVVVATDDGRRVQCGRPTCCKLFKTRAELIHHTRIHTAENRFECSNCGKRFTYICDLTRHSRVHSGEKPFECTTCGHKFTRNGDLTIHSLIHTGEKPFECTTCGRRFRRNDNLKKHSRRHTGERPFVCTKCDQRFAQHGDLTRHSRVHTEEKRFECATCGQRFRLNGDLTRHCNIHTGEKPFECTTCDQRFTRNGDLTKHSRIHSGERPFECATCGQKFTRSYNLARHRRIHTERP